MVGYPIQIPELIVSHIPLISHSYPTSPPTKMVLFAQVRSRLVARGIEGAAESRRCTAVPPWPSPWLWAGSKVGQELIDLWEIPTGRGPLAISFVNTSDYSYIRLYPL